jgi:hypothetical protein
MESKYPFLGKIDSDRDPDLIRYINFKLASLGMPYIGKTKINHQAGSAAATAGEMNDPNTTPSASTFIKVASNLIQNYNERIRRQRG